MEILAHYKGCEQAYVKHKLLETYLERLFMIVGQHQRSICYVDCFAGPWQGESEDLSDTSIGISLKIMAKCREGLHQHGKDVQFRALFVEKSQKAYGKLTSFLDSWDQAIVQADSRQGEFYNLRSEILNWCGKDSFTFFFIDPKGWKQAVEIATLRPLLERPRSEFIITFMYDFLVRTHTQTPFQEDMLAIFGEVPDTQGMTSEQRETFLLHKYRQHLKKVQPASGGKPRSACVQVLYPTRDRTLYHLVYLTRHPKGITEFMQASEKLELVQKKVRAQAKQESRVEKTKQTELFPAHEEVGEVSERFDLSEIMVFWLSKLSHSPRRFGIQELADMLEETGWFESDFQKAFKELEKEQKVKNQDAKRARPVNVVNFDKGEMLVRLV